ncbi:hypothetical protein BGZ80_001016 [Entomortierella chlamydospora]|uniref:Uncharacterized protein n=1 Tax=Entomortierella chlamydospora TaxID=101097 RepID=A0A9P6MRK1_9FUNG|nr:hypothetical protein BGZ80_001016 [Entomortierella chlamydospora]
MQSAKLESLANSLQLAPVREDFEMSSPFLGSTTRVGSVAVTLAPSAAPIANLGPKPTAPDRASDADLASREGAGAFSYHFDSFIKRLTDWHARAGSSMASEDLYALWSFTYSYQMLKSCSLLAIMQQF